MDAYARDEQELATFYRTRFREEFGPVVEAWIATRPLKNPDAPLTPFAMPQYQLAAATEAGELDQQAEGLGEDVVIVDGRRGRGAVRWVRWCHHTGDYGQAKARALS